MKRLNELIQIKHIFDSQYKKDKYLYTYIAPKDQNQFIRFTSHVMNTPALTGSMYEILSNNNSVRSILQENFPGDIELEIYIATDDRYSALAFQGALRDYIKRNNIDFEY